MPEHAAVFWRGWHDLRFDRQYGAFGGQSPISFTAIDGYARRYGIIDTHFDVFKTIVLQMDDEYLQHVSREEEKARQERDNADNPKVNPSASE